MYETTTERERKNEERDFFLLNFVLVENDFKKEAKFKQNKIKMNQN